MPDEISLQISTILLNWNRAELLSKTISSYLKTINADYELIVVDNNSEDKSVEVIKAICENHLNHHAILLNKNVGGEALNIGAESARGKYIHFSENDIEYLPGWWEELQNKFEKFPELGLLSPFSPFPEKEIGEIFCVKETRPLVKDGAKIYISDDNVGTTSIIRREIWEKGIQWKSYGDGDTWFPDDGSFSDDVRQKGYLVAYNDRYVVINWGHNITEFKKDPDYYVNNYKSKLWFGVDGFKKRLEEHGYTLLYNSNNGEYKIIPGDRHMDNSSINNSSYSINNADSQPILWDDPNKYARPASIEVYDHYVRFHGYQEYILTRDTLTVAEDLVLQKKLQLLTPYLNIHYLSHRTLLDLGANAGFFCFLAVQNGADHAVAVDMDNQYISMMQTAIEKFKFQNIEVIDTNLTEYKDKADITLALALIHWIYSCTAVYGNLDTAVRKLSQLTKYMLIIEWVDPDDPAVEFFRHIDWNKDHISDAYNITSFENALADNFCRFKMVGEISNTRKMYIAYKTAHFVDLSGNFPLLYPVDMIISRQCLATFNGIEYWSCVYDVGENIVKQASLDLAKHEYKILSRLNSKYFPRVYDLNSADSYSTITMEKIKGSALNDSIPVINETSEAFSIFVQHCLVILNELAQQHITHRDLRADNMIIRDGIPVLIDFGWAISADSSIFTPDTLGAEGKPPDNTYCDIYSMGLILRQVNNRKYPLFDRVIETMVETDISLRITNLAILQALFLHVAE